MTDLTPEEEGRVRRAMRFLSKRGGGWKPLAKALGFSIYTVRHVNKSEQAVSASMTVRVAKLAGVPVDDLLSGRFPPVGACPHCGQASQQTPKAISSRLTA